MRRTSTTGGWPASVPVGFLTLAAAVAVLLTLAQPAAAQDFSAWTHARTVAITNAGAALADHQVRVDLDAGNFDFAVAQPDGADLRFLDTDGSTLLPYWIETWDPIAEAATIWLRVSDLPAAGTSECSLLYGNPAAAPSSDGTAAFPAYDGFETTPIVGNPGEWARYTGNPVLTEGAAGTWDDHGATFASVIWDAAAGEFRMYYHGFSGGVHQIGLATSTDGLNWTKYAGNPIVTPGPAAWDGQSVRVPMVWKEGADYHMIYTGNGSGGMQVGYATSTDGISWTKNPANPVFNDPTWASGQTENWGVMKVGNEYQMWYSNFGMRESSLAVSTDLVNWTPYQTDPIFASSGNPADDRYSQYCPFSFKYGDDYYVLVPSYDSGGNYAKFYLYRSASPYFPEAERELVRIAHTVGEAGTWDAHDSDTPALLTLDIERTQFYNDELWCYYAAEGGADYWKVGLHLEADLAAALTPVAPPPTPSIGWTVAGDVTRVADPVHSGVGSMLQNDASASASTQLTGSFTARTTGAVSAWLRRDNTTPGDFDLYMYGNGGATLSAVAGLGRDGDFHYWNGAFQATGVPWAVDTWYRVELAFDALAGTFDFVVQDAAFSELLRVEGVAFGNPAPSLGRVVGYTSSGFVGGGVLDDVSVRNVADPEPTVTVGAAGAPNTIAVDAAAVGAITTVTPCVTAVPVTIARTDATPVRGFSVTFGLSPELALCDNVNSSILAGSYLDGFGDGAQFYTLDNLDGTYTVDAVVLGLPCGATADQGTLFTVDLTGTVAEGTGTVTVLAVELRDCANQVLEVDAGPAAAIVIDTVAPLPVTDMTVVQWATGNGAGQTVAVDVTWTGSASPDAALVAVYRQGFGDYPEYDDGTGTEPTLDAGATPAEAEAAGWTLVDVTAGSATTDHQPERDAWSYVAFTEDALGNVSVPSALTAGVVNYLLGDVSDGVVPGGETLPGDGDNQVTGLDVSLLGNYYGLSIGLGHEANRLDIGPLVGDPLLGRPLTDDLIEFEDLILFGINFGLNARLVKQQALAYDVPAPAAENSLTVEVGAPAAVGEELLVRLVLAGDGRIQALSVPLTWDASVVEPVAVRSGELLAAQGGTGLALSPRAGTVDIGLLGVRERGISGRGVIAEMAFRVLAAGEPGIGVGEIRARTAKNEAVDLSGTVDVATDTPTALPVVTTLHGAAPNPFNPATTLAYDIATGGRVTLKIYSIDGRLVRTLVDETALPGHYSRVWQGRDEGGRTVASGTYVVRLVAPGRTETRRMMLVK